MTQTVKLCLQYGRPGSDPWVRKIPWRREWLPTPVFWPGEVHEQRSLAGYSPWDQKDLGKNEELTPPTFTFLLFSYSAVSSCSTETAVPQVSLFFTISWSLPKLMFIELVMSSNRLILYHPLLPPIFNLSQYQGFFQ